MTPTKVSQVVSCFCCVAVLHFADVAWAKRPTPIGRKLAEFTLKDYRGKTYSLDDFRDDPVVVLAFLGTECPLAKLYANRLEEISRDYSDRGVRVIGINANVQDSITEIAAHVRIHNVTFPVLKDLGNRVADQIGAVRTPEVFVLDVTRAVRYWGRIDDQYGIDYVRDAPRRNDLRIALDQLLAGEPVQTPATVSIGCHIGRVQQPKPDATVTYSNHISRILQRRCIECHRDGEIAPFALTEYDEVVGWAEMIDEVVRQRRMPPWHANPQFGHFANDRLLSDEEKQLIYQWVADGAPHGDPKNLPVPVQYVEGWQLPRRPDVQFSIQSKPYEVQADGEVKYQWFSVDPKFTEDKWIKSAEILPGNRAVVHHILAFERGPRQPRAGGGERGFLVGYVPGMRAMSFPEGMAKLIPAGSQLIFQVHYTPIGSVQHDQSKIGFIFADAHEVKQRVMTSSAVTHRFAIPPHDDNYLVEANSPTSPVEVSLLSLMPHMHLRGKSFRYEAVFPDGDREVLLDVPNYDFNWQTAYRLAKPKSFPAGTFIHAIARFDNSAANLNNPDATKTVRWGHQTTDEMMIGYFDVSIPRKVKQLSRQ